MRRAALLLLLLAGTANAEYIPGFSLYGHTAAADLIVELEIPAEGRPRLLATLLGRWQGDPLPTLDPETLSWRPEGATRAFVFLKEGKPYVDDTGVAWISKDGVFLLPDNWGYGVAYPVDYRDPTPEEFRKAVRTAAADREEVARIAATRLGPERALDASRLLGKERPDVAWYVVFGHALRFPFDLDWSTPVPERGVYLSELRLALARALGDLTPEEEKALLGRIASLPPGAVRREHVELVLGTKAFDVLQACHETAVEIEEWVATARAMRSADATRADALLIAEATAKEPERAQRLLDDVLDARETAALDLATRLGRGLLEATAGGDGLDYRVCAFLAAGRRAADRALLLAMARSGLPCRAQALVHLREWTGKSWEAPDERWDALLEGR